MPAEAIPSRPPLLPRGKAARWALGLLLAFTFLKGVIWAVTVPAFWAPDEDYHFLYVEFLTTQHALIDPDRDLYPPEYRETAIAIDYDSYGQGVRQSFDGDPKASVRELAKLPDSAREPSEPGRGVGVVHPPLYHLAGVAVNATLGDASVLTRLTAVRFVSALFAALSVYLAWLLAAQVLSRFRLQFVAALVVSAQPTFSFLSGVVNHDQALIAFYTGAVAMMLFMVRTPPRPRQGLWLGALITLALLVKGTALVLLPLALLAYLAQGLTYRESWRQAARSAALALGVVALLAGWWYVRAKFAYGSFTGATTGVTEGTGVPESPGLGGYLQWVRDWIGLTYRTYWFHFVYFEGPASVGWDYRLPIVVGAVGMAGLGVVLWDKRRALLDPDDPGLRHVAVMVAAVLIIVVPFLGVDLARRADGLGYFANGGRYLMPAYACAATMLVLGVCRLFRGRAEPLALAAVSLLALLISARVFDRYWVNRYFGHYDPWELLRRISFDRPEFVTPTSITITIALAGAALLAAVVLAARETSRA